MKLIGKSLTTSRDFSVKTISGKEKQSTRDKILHTIKTVHEATVEDLAEAADVSPVTVRHHLNALQAENLIVAESIRRSVGRPHYVYSLSEAGHELFPQKYFRLSSRLIEELKDRFSPQVISEVFDSVAERIMDEHRGEFEHLSFEKKLSYLVNLLSEEGFLANWEKVDDGYQLIEYSCPYLSMGETHNEICTFDKGLILGVLQTDIQQHSCMINGDSCCQFTISDPESN